LKLIFVVGGALLLWVLAPRGISSGPLEVSRLPADNILSSWLEVYVFRTAISRGNDSD
jgi:hypothetical protein